MKRKDNKQTLGEAIKSLISDLGMEEKLLSVQAEELFADMMKGVIMKYVLEVYVNKRVLFVKMNSPELKNELQYGKSKIIAHINEGIGKAYLLDVKFL
ncbi:DciA family protein [Moheibacter sp.]|uniref:DciA family protein n=1 Tax=Moheibacter sp. TaxID=1965316 RepID=UPI003C711218